MLFWISAVDAQKIKQVPANKLNEQNLTFLKISWVTYSFRGRECAICNLWLKADLAGRLKQPSNTKLTIFSRIDSVILTFDDLDILTR